ncbi:hypothetical protein [Rheinheimera faecalis]
MTNPQPITDIHEKQENHALDSIHRVIDWATKNLEAIVASKSKLQSRQYVSSQRLVGNFIKSYDFDFSLLNVVLDGLKDCQYAWLLSHQIAFIRVSILKKTINAGLRTCDRLRLIVLGITELLRATSKYARAPP